MTSAACFSRSGIHGPSSGTMPPTVRAMSGSCLPALLGLGLPLLLGLGPVERGPLGELPAAHLGEEPFGRLAEVAGEAEDEGSPPASPKFAAIFSVSSSLIPDIPAATL